jgi:hypothetical protein
VQTGQSRKGLFGMEIGRFLDNLFAELLEKLITTSCRSANADTALTFRDYSE